ncbi:hypothetical protein HON71_03135 [Candidatus Woesearchaeota archaeon]|mgnify:CR=1 FL=1|jgi:uncharacterized protein|nr:hypothetical protein [Candidatus Woesearchaeota archaeon]MBT5342242.1 hypothetical protein [Candidatus Woesearchaeota archaeon]
MKRVVICTLILVILITLASTTVLAVNTAPYHMKLLAVQENGETYTGSDADLFLELKAGSGRVFLDTFPLTKMDTQISTRFAKEIACKHFKLDCNNYDFIFTIKARSNIIGGPSAGAAIAALTTIAILDLDYNKDITITGTINSGGIIGPVGGVKEKLEAAANVNLKKVLIAKGTSQQETFDKELNQTKKINLIEFGKKDLKLDVEEVIDLDTVLFHLTGINLNNNKVKVSEDTEYKEIMLSLQNILCGRTEKIEEEISQDNVIFNQNLSKEIHSRKEKAINASNKGDYYSAASFCFGNNIFIKNNYYQEKILTKAKLINLFNILEKKTNSLEKKLGEQEIKTISDLQTLMVVKERLSDVKDQIKKFDAERGQLVLADMYYLLAYGEERYFSALSWMQFFSMEGKKFKVDKDTLRDSCLQKISEAEERHQYASLFIGQFNVLNIIDKIESAKEAQIKGEFELCLIKAAQAKAEANAILSSMGLSDDNIDEFIESKITAVEKVISDNSAEGIFPILGYSYYQYANTLKKSEKYMVMIYLEYALEMSELSIYFPAEDELLRKANGTFQLKRDYLLILVGFLIGVLVTMIIFIIERGWFRRMPKLNFIRKK